MNKFAALVCGYGVPQDIMTDLNYNAYLRQVFNYLFDGWRDVPGVVFFNGGPTDCYPPYRRSEAGEMGKWWRQAMAKLKVPPPWTLRVQPQSLSSVENILNFAAALKSPADQKLPYGKNWSGVSQLVFCEFTRRKRIARLIKEVFGRTPLRLVAIDFDGSVRRYQPRRAQWERDLLRLELRAIHDPATWRQLRLFMKKKLALMRQYDVEEAHRRLPEILDKLHLEFKTIFSTPTPRS